MTTQQPDDELGLADGTDAEAAPEAVEGPFGPATWPRALVLALALALLGGAIGWAIGQRDDDGLGSNDVGYMRDMFAHHTQAVQMSLLLLYKDEVPRELKSFAQEIVHEQRYEQGIFNALLVRGGYEVADPDGMSMGWMGAEVPVAEMFGMATEEQMKALRDAEGEDAEALFIGLMNEHHLGGIHMADMAARHAEDRTVRNMAKASIHNQRGEVIDLNNYRKRHDLPLVEGFEDPMSDPRLNPVGALDED